MKTRCLAVGIAALTISGCGGAEADRDSYVQQNEAILKSLPTFPGSRPQAVATFFFVVVIDHDYYGTRDAFQ